MLFFFCLFVFFLLILLIDAKKRKALLQYSKFLKVIGGETNSLLGNLLSPEAPSAKAAEVLFEVLFKRTPETRPILIAER